MGDAEASVSVGAEVRSMAEVSEDGAGERAWVTGPGAADRFAGVFDDHAAGLWRFLARQLDAATAEDLVAETFLVAWSARDDYVAARGTVRAWLYGIAVNLLRRHRRTQHQQARMSQRLSGLGLIGDGGAERVAERLDARTQVQALATAIAALPDGDRDVLLLSSLAGLDCTEVATALGIPEGTVRSRLHRVRRSLRATASRTIPPTVKGHS